MCELGNNGNLFSSSCSSLVPVTEASTIIAVSSAHRAASLEAVSYAIDSLKAKVPIWKKVSEGNTSLCRGDLILCIDKGCD